MPLYEFECPGCKLKFEEFFKTHDEKIADCPECGLSSKKMMSAPRTQINFKAGYMATLGEECNSEKEYYEKHAAMRRRLQKKYGE